MIKLLDSIRTNTESYGPPYAGPALQAKEHALPADYWAVVAVADGFISTNRPFRLFDVASMCSHNQAAWVGEYGDLLRSFVTVAEDIFGDQYGYEVTNSGLRLAKFFCEGGHVEPCSPTELPEFLQENVLAARPRALDSSLALAAIDAGLMCSANEHLAFSLPLVAGGAYTIENLSVETRDLHLGILGQMSLANRDLPDGARIERFSVSDPKRTT